MEQYFNFHHPLCIIKVTPRNRKNPNWKGESIQMCARLTLELWTLQQLWRRSTRQTRQPWSSGSQTVFLRRREAADGSQQAAEACLFLYLQQRSFIVTSMTLKGSRGANLMLSAEPRWHLEGFRRLQGTTQPSWSVCECDVLRECS